MDGWEEIWTNGWDEVGGGAVEEGAVETRKSRLSWAGRRKMQGDGHKGHNQSGSQWGRIARMEAVIGADEPRGS